MPRILIIEDDPIYREMIEEALTMEGYETVTAEDGLQGIERARGYDPDLVISDVVMDKADGYEVLATLRNEPSTVGIPFIMITGWSSKGGQRQGMAMGADDYLSKPFNATELLESVAAQLKKKERASTSQAARTASVSLGVSAIVPRELQQPLQTITGFSAILSRDGGSINRGELADMARHIHAAAFRIQRWVDNFVLHTQLQLLQEDAERQEALRKARTDEIASFVDTLSKNLARERGREADLRLTLADGSAAIEEPYLRRVVGELIDNAFKFSPPGTEVLVRTAFSRDRFGFSVQDQGRGMTAEQIGAMDAFTQFGHGEYGQEGVGLGLAVVKSIVRLHGGALKISSDPGGGTRVGVELPR